jgi:RNA polymerase sigma-70 factor (ECF subfamily)
VLAQRAESVTLAFLVLLETLSAEERAVFLLKELFEYDHGEIAEMLGTTTANSRQLLHRAKEKVAARPHADVAGSDARRSREARRRVAERFAAAFYAGDGGALTELLAADVSFVADGGGKVPSARRPIHGRSEVLNFLIGVHRAARNAGLAREAALRAIEVNAEPALAVRVAGRLDSIYVFGIDAEGLVEHIRVVRNPDKLAYIDRQLARMM